MSDTRTGQRSIHDLDEIQEHKSKMAELRNGRRSRLTRLRAIKLRQDNLLKK